MVEISSLGAKSLTNYVGAKILAGVESSPANNSVITNATNQNNETFTENVLQTLKNLGIDTLDSSSENTKAAIQTFTQNLYQALTNAPFSGVNAIESTDTNMPTPLVISGGTNFKYSVDFSEANLGNFLPDVQANIITALENIGKYIRSDAVFNLKVLSTTEDTTMLAQANANVVKTENNPDNANADTLFIADSIRGADFDSNLSDSKLYINSTKLDQMSFSGLPTPDKYDLTSILTHEIFHGLAFTGLADVPPELNINNLKTGYDSLITKKEDGSLIFVGRHAKAANSGNPVPLSSAEEASGSSYYHVAIPDDLMSSSIRKNEVKSISNLDVAMLEDIGVNITGVLPTNSNIKTAYSQPSTFLNSIESLANNQALQNDFTQVFQSSDKGETTHFQNFLTQLSASFNQALSTQTGMGSLFLASA